jgi:dipeptidyl aminopeptidase/acylaminoacyl peptidase/predicted Ser/Thr protein kinase
MGRDHREGEGADALAAVAETSPMLAGITSVEARLGRHDSSPPLARGSCIGRYVIDQLLGAGGMGIVYRAHDPQLGRAVALKLVRPQHTRGTPDPEASARLLREAQAMAKVSHPNIVSVFDVGLFGDELFLAMELVDGVTLTEWLRQRARPWREVLRAVAQAGRALEAAHVAGLVHRDFKPDNVLVGRDGRVRMMDLGLARFADTPKADTAALAEAETSQPMAKPCLTGAGAVLGTPFYMAPEQHRGQPADARSDQFSFCVSLFEALYGQRPFTANTRRELLRQMTERQIGDPPPSTGVPGWVHRILVRGLSSAPEARFPSMTALLASLEAGERRRRVAGLAGGGLIAVALVGILGYRIAERDPLPAQQPRPPAARLRTDLERQVTFTGSAESAELSPDGLSLAFISGDMPKVRVVVQSLATGAARTVFWSRGRTSIRWSPDGTRLVIPTDVGTFVVPKDGGEPRALRAVGRVTDGVAWAPDSASIAVLPSIGDLLFENLSTGETRTVTLSIPSQVILGLDWSTTHDRLLLLTEEKAGVAVWTLLPDGSGLVKVFTDPNATHASTPRWTRDGFTYICQRGGKREISEVRISAGGAALEPEPLLALPNLGTGYSYSPDRQWLAYDLTTLEVDIHVLAPGQAPRQLTSGTQLKHGLAFSADGAQVAFVMGAGLTRWGQLFIVPTAGGPPRQLTTSPRQILDVAWSPDGRWIAYSAAVDGENSFELRRVEVVGGADEALPAPGLSQPGLIAWGAGNRLLYPCEDGRNFTVLDSESGERRLLLPAGSSAPMLLRPSISPDGKRVAVLRQREQADGDALLAISLEDGRQAVIAPGSLIPVGWTSDGSSIVAAELSHLFERFVSIPAEGGPPQPVLELPANLGGAMPAMVPGKSVFGVLEIRQEADIWVAGEVSPGAIAAVAAPPIDPVLPPPGFSVFPNSEPTNLDFEQGALGDLPAGWHVPAWSELRAGATTSADRPFEGQGCALFEATKPPVPGFARVNFMQLTDGHPFRNKHLRLRAALRTEANATLWIRAETETGTTIEGRPTDAVGPLVTSGRWTVRELVLDTPENAEWVTFGITLEGMGRAWLDAVDLAVTPSPPAR